jgi:vacuolar-type H+-ATPase subunit I/STV1
MNMPKTKAATIPDVRVLRDFMEEYQDMLRDAQQGVKRVLALNPQTEKFWDELTNLATKISLVADRSDTLWEEIVRLIDELPED